VRLHAGDRVCWKAQQLIILNESVICCRLVDVVWPRLLQAFMHAWVHVMCLSLSKRHGKVDVIVWHCKQVLHEHGWLKHNK
jgi:hypothetical protein